MGDDHRGLDDRLLDALGDIAGVEFDGPVWRVVRDGRSPLDGSRGSGRWNPSELSVLYCAQLPDGALAEIFFHLSRGQSVFPSRMRHSLFELTVNTANTLQLLDLDHLRRLGVDDARYHEILYDRTQEIAAAAAFLGFDGIIAPNARYQCNNLVLFLEDFPMDRIGVVSQEPVDWDDWRTAQQ